MEENKSNGMAVASLVLGIIGLVCLFFLPVLTIILSIVGLVLAIMGKKKNPSGVATAGLVLNIIGLVLSVIIFVACTACVGAIGGMGSAFGDALSSSLY